MKKKTIVTSIDVIDIARKGFAVGKTATGEVVMVKGAIPGDKVDVLLHKKKKGIWHGEVEKFLSRSPYLIEPVCSHFSECGGCKWQQMSYESQTQFKEKAVKDAFKRIAKVPVGEILPIKVSPQQFYYRNKLEYSFSALPWLTKADVNSSETLRKLPAAGFHPAENFAKVVQVEKCHLQPEPTNEIRNFVREYGLKNDLSFFNTWKNTGFLRNLIIRDNRKGEVMVVVIVGNESEQLTPLLQAIKDKFPQIISLYYIINTKVNDSVFDLEPILFSGVKWLPENLHHVKFFIGPKSFFQTNTHQTEQMYAYVKEKSELTGTEMVFDLYSGIGSIAQYVADGCKQVIAIEENKAAVEDGKKNVRLNEIKNVRFFAGDTRKVIKEQNVLHDNIPDVIITDPPRAGMHEDVCLALKVSRAKRIIYISCNPSTQARDIALISEKYKVKSLQPFDMFPHTDHVECVAELILR
jgi:23S rRNA (uracil1939-C5)-methyltransferase